MAKLFIDILGYQSKLFRFLKPPGQELVVSGKHYNATENGFDTCEFQRKYTIPDTIDMHTLTSNITPNG